MQRRRILAAEGKAAAPARLSVRARRRLDDVVRADIAEVPGFHALAIALSCAREALAAKRAWELARPPDRAR